MTLPLKFCMFSPANSELKLNEKALRETQTLRTDWPKISPRRRHFPGVHDGQNLIRLRWSLPSLTDPVW